MTFWIKLINFRKVYIVGKYMEIVWYKCIPVQQFLCVIELGIHFVITCLMSIDMNSHFFG